MDDLVKSLIISKAKQVKGWLEEREISFLIECVEKVSLKEMQYSGPLNIVEIGSYHGRSTIAIGLTVAALNLDAIIYAIDPHEGLRSGRYDEIYLEASTYDIFIRNINHYRLEKLIKCIKSKSQETNLNIPISLIFFDGLHLYENVKEDFLHFENNLVRGSLILFHDYADEFPGVLRFVDSLMSIQNPNPYLKVGQAGSLIVLMKVS